MSKQIAEIHDEDIGLVSSSKSFADFSIRHAARAVVFDENQQVALLNVSNHGYHKLPGGGVEGEEEITQALSRELNEEIGCKATITHEIGRLDEFRSAWEFHQLSDCFIAQTFGEKGMPDFTDEEIEDGFEIAWVGSIDTAINTLEQDKPDNYEGKFIQLRDLTILRLAKDMLTS